MPAVDHRGMVGKPCAEAVANHSDCVLHMYTLLCRRTYERIEGNRVHAHHLSHPPQLVISAGRLDEGAVEGRQQSMIPLQRTYFHVYICMRARVTVCVCAPMCVSVRLCACIHALAQRYDRASPCWCTHAHCVWHVVRQATAYRNGTHI